MPPGAGWQRGRGTRRPPSPGFCAFRIAARRSTCASQMGVEPPGCCVRCRATITHGSGRAGDAIRSSTIVRSGRIPTVRRDEHSAGRRDSSSTRSPHGCRRTSSTVPGFALPPSQSRDLAVPGCPRRRGTRLMVTRSERSLRSGRRSCTVAVATARQGRQRSRHTGRVW